jgi:ABC-type Fe3+-hydroxamate transport system substrate-binding protein
MIHRARWLGLATALGCGTPEPPPATTTFLGPSGAAVVLHDLPVERIVSVMASATEWLLLLGAESMLVARTEYDRQPELAHLPSLGGGLETSPEVVAALHPDVVLGWRIGASVEMSRALEPFDIPVIAVEATDTAEAFEQLTALARLVGREQRGREVADSLRTTLARLRTGACPVGTEPETAMIQVSAVPPMTAGGATWMSELLGGACLRNAFAELVIPWANISLESVVERQPRWLVTSRAGAPGARLAELRGQVGWRDLDAVREGRVLELDGDTFSRAGPGMAAWVEAVQAELRRVRGDR